MVSVYYPSRWESERKAKRTQISTVIDELGLQPNAQTPARGVQKFDNRYVTALAAAVTAIAKGLKGLDEKELVDAARSGKYVAEEIEGLLEQYGEDIWGRNAERAHLKKDLVFERESDRKLLKERLHDWIFLKAFNKWRNSKQYANRKAQLAEESMNQEQEAESSDEEELDAGAEAPIPSTNNPNDNKHTSSTPTRLYHPYFPITEPWSEQQWSSFRARPKVNLHTILTSLGLIPRSVNIAKAYIPRCFENDPTLVAFSDELTTIAKRVQMSLDAKDVAKAAANPNYLDAEIDELLYNFGPDLWGQHLEVKEDRNRLEYENDEQRQIIWLHIHQWIFMKVYNSVRYVDWVSNGKKRKPRSRSRDSSERSKKAKTDTGAKSKKNITDAQDEADNSDWETITDADENEGLEVDEDTAIHGRNKLADLLRKYFLDSNRNDDAFGETALLNELEHECAANSDVFTSALPPSDKPLLATFSSILAAWIDWRRTVVRIKAYLPSLPPNPAIANKQRAILASTIREKREAFQRMKVDIAGLKMGPEDALCVGCIKIMGLKGTTKEGKEILRVFRDRLAGFAAEVGDLEGDELTVGE